MKRLLLLTLILTILLAPFSLVRAQSPNLPPSEDNACYPGGAMYRPNQVGQGCPDEWHWMCGWYLARYLIQDRTRRITEIPVACRSLLATLPRSLGGLLDDSGGDDGDNNTLPDNSGPFTYDPHCYMEVSWSGIPVNTEVFYSMSGNGYGVYSGSFIVGAVNGTEQLIDNQVQDDTGTFTLILSFGGKDYTLTGTLPGNIGC